MQQGRQIEASLHQSVDDRHGCLNYGTLTLLEMSLSIHGEIQDQHHAEMPIFIITALFLVSVVVFFLNLLMLMAQPVSVHERSYSHMICFACLSQIKIAVETIQTGTKQPVWR